MLSTMGRVTILNTTVASAERYLVLSTIYLAICELSISLLLLGLGLGKRTRLRISNKILLDKLYGYGIN
jgi:hypothetical protein